MSPEQEMVAEFHRKFGVPSSELQYTRDFGLVLEGPFRGTLRVELIREELHEFQSAVEREDVVAMADALGDLLYVVYGAAEEAGIDLEPVFREIHRTNMAKEGGPTRRDGKILKPVGWCGPDLETILRRQAV